MKTKNIAIAFLSLMALTSSCSDKDFGLNDGGFSGKPVDIPVQFAMVPENTGYADRDIRTNTATYCCNGSAEASTVSRAPSNINETAVSDVWTLQFDGTDLTSKLVGVAKYTDLTKGKIISFVDSEGATHRIVFVGNIHSGANFWNLETGKSTYQDLLNVINTISTESQSYNTAGLLMCGTFTGTVDKNTDLTNIKMTRNMAKVELALSLDTKAAGFKIISVQLCQAATVFSPTEALNESLNTTIHTRDVPYPDPYQYPTIDYSEVKASSTVVMPTPGGTSTTFQWYVPANLQGTVNNNLKSQKTGFAPDGATYILIKALDNNGNLVTYSLYPGANLYNDYNLRANYKYHIALNILGVGDPDANTNITYFGDMDYTQKTSSNCYILNPPLLSEANARVYKIPVRRVDEYWGDVRFVGSGHEKLYTLGTDSKWAVALLWQDHPNIVRTTGNNFVTITRAAGTGKEDYFSLKVPYGATHGNFVVAISKGSTFDEKNILWSWHFWVTDYDPYSKAITAVANKYAYNVSGGQLHRYKDNNVKLWSGEYATKFIMDRNLGSDLHTANTTKDPDYSLTYQFGRKDPLPIVPIYNIGGTPISRPEASNSHESIAYSIAHPLQYIGFNANYEQWVNDKMYDSQGVDVGQSSYDNNTNGVSFRCWNDPRYASTDQNVKSIFDPSPWGFKVPRSTTWSDFSNNGTTNPTVNVGTPINRAFPYTYDTANGVLYWPYLKVGTSYPVRGQIFYPNGSTRCCEPIEYRTSPVFQFGNGGVGQYGPCTRAAENFVRSIQE